jgi:hypothetical protein
MQLAPSDNMTKAIGPADGRVFRIAKPEKKVRVAGKLGGKEFS